MTASEGRRIQTVLKAFEIIEVLKELDSAPIRELDTHVDLSKGSLHTHLATLCESGFVTQDGDEYKLGLRFVMMGEYVRNHIPVYMAAKDEIDAFAEECGEYAHLIVEDDGHEIALYESRGDQAIATDYHIQLREDPQLLHNSSAGKAILASLPEYRVDEIIEQKGLQASTANTITDPDELKRTLETVREQGYAQNDEEEMRGIRAVGAPIRGPDGGVRGAVSVTAPTSRLSGDRFNEEIPAMVTRTANVIEINLATKDFNDRQ
ncbi:IclR family transcriptional regulator [Halobacteria archaeon AArc-curdl1]|uniref:IclR family transcriptional regulator n=1 Tax=Natronosalvus hydrolyticus TaxID=2979988 RepID=A0AAP2Z6X9_9EURY|nr:IclR family transcriptional regulator [Halobacteria archaeon AArc-curdl1]